MSTAEGRSSALSGFQQELRCPVCQDFFQEPALLSCGHHICASHLSPQGEQIQCQVCNETTVSTAVGLRVDAAFQTIVNFWKTEGEALQSAAQSSTAKCGFCEEQPGTRRCLQCAGVLCEACEKTSHSKGFFKSHTVIDVADGVGSQVDSRMLCHQHAGEKLHFYCLDCRWPVCSHCLILGEHKGHEQQTIDQAFSIGKDTLFHWTTSVDKRITQAEELLEQLRTSDSDVTKAAEAQRNVINSEMDNLRELVETKRQQLLSKSAIEEKQKRVQLQGQRERVENLHNAASTLLQRAEAIKAAPGMHTFLVLLLPLIKEIQKDVNLPLDDGVRVSTQFRPLSTDAQVRSLGDLELGHPKPPVHFPAIASAPAPVQAAQIGASYVVAGNYPSAAPAQMLHTTAFLPQPHLVQPQPQVQPLHYVYRPA